MSRRVKETFEDVKRAMTNGRVKARAAKARRAATCKQALDLVLIWLGDTAVPRDVLDRGSGEDHLRCIVRTRAACRELSGGSRFVASSWDRLLYSYCAALDVAIEDKLCDQDWAQAEHIRLSELTYAGPGAACVSFQNLIADFGGQMGTIYAMGGGKAGARAALNISCMAGGVAGGRLDPSSQMFLYLQAAEIFRVQTVMAYMAHCPGLRPCLGGDWFRDASSFLKAWFHTLPAEWRGVETAQLSAEAALSVLPFDTVGK